MTPRLARAALAVNIRDPYERALAMLEPKQSKFVREYLKDRNATQAAIRSGYSRKTANRIASRLLSKVDVWDAFRAGEAKEQAADEAYIRRLRRENRRIALFDPKDLFDAEGNILPLPDWPPDARACIAGVELILKNAKAGDGIIDEVLKLKFWNKNDAIKLDYEAYGLTDGEGGEKAPDVPAFIVRVRPDIT